METIQASTQYDDFTGGAAADVSDTIGSIGSYLKGKSLMKDDEHPIAINFYSGVNGQFSVEIIVAPLSGYDNVSAWLTSTPDPLPVRKVGLQVSLSDFFDLFKRFNIVIAPKGLDVIGRAY